MQHTKTLAVVGATVHAHILSLGLIPSFLADRSAVTKELQ
jgi:hypothetical protein